MDYKNLAIRTLSGAVLVGVIVTAALDTSNYIFCAVFGLISLFATKELMIINGIQRWKAWTAGVASAVLFMTIQLFFHFAFSIIFSVYIALLLFLIIIELWQQGENPIKNWSILGLSQIYIAWPFALMHVLKACETPMVLAMFILIWANDTFAFLTGCYLGKHKMFERISPKKTWEGFIGGNVFALVAAIVLSIFYKEFALWQWLIIGEVVVVFGTLGDLVESLIKRTLGIKDSGNAIPGHGGWLDRFDSAILATLALVIVVTLFNL